jgi:heat shock protein HtpX
MASYFDEIHKNNLKSILLMGLFFAIFLSFIYVFVLFFGGGLFVLILGAAIVAIYALIAYFSGGKVVLAISKAQKVDRKDYPILFDAVEGMAAATQIPVPEIYVINDPNPNAFATGRNRKHAYVAATTGLLSMMNKDELEGVIAHEISHISDNDILFMMIAVVFAGAIGLLAAVLRNMFFFGGMARGNKNGGLLIIIGLVGAIVAPIVALLIRLAISRRREYIADANGARLTRQPSALASALEKIKAYDARPATAPVKNANDMTASLYFSNPFKKNSVMNLFSTHPPIDERIKKLKAMY